VEIIKYFPLDALPVRLLQDSIYTILTKKMNESTISREIYYFRKESHKPTIFELFGLQRATFLLLGAAILLVVVFFKELVVECDCGGDRGRFGSVASTRAFTMISARTSPVARHNDGFFRTFFMLGCLHQVFSQSDQQCPRDPRKRRGRGRRQRKLVSKSGSSSAPS